MGGTQVEGTDAGWKTNHTSGPRAGGCRRPVIPSSSTGLSTAAGPARPLAHPPRDPCSGPARSATGVCAAHSDRRRSTVVHPVARVPRSIRRSRSVHRSSPRDGGLTLGSRTKNLARRSLRCARNCDRGPPTLGFRAPSRRALGPRRGPSSRRPWGAGPRALHGPGGMAHDRFGFGFGFGARRLGADPRGPFDQQTTIW